MPHPVASYFAELHASLGAGTPETSGYNALGNLLNAVGAELKPKIGAVLQLKDTGGKHPDGGLFYAKELQRRGVSSPALLDFKPERGVIEVKGLAQDLGGLEQTPQVRGYLEHYGQILLTNYRAFALFSWENGKPVAGERFSLAGSETEFWHTAHSGKNDPILHERLWQFLRRALLSNARIAKPEDLAAFLASYAREARARVEVAPMKTLEPVKKALGDALGISFEGEKGEHFFRSTLIQTLFYGIFSAWVLWHESHPKPSDRFQWKTAAFHLGLPVLRTLFVQLADPAKVRALNLEEVLDWAEACLARVDRFAFFARYDMGEAVQYFYEPFLAEFDPELRKSFGVWYTPPEIVKYMVARVDASLRENFNLPDGLADSRVVVLDPCCGTGAYLVETLRLIYQRLKDSRGEAQAALQIKEVAQKRLYGFELLPAPYVVSHLQIDLMLTRWGAPLEHEKDERAGVFLTNALTGWVPPKAPKDQLLFQEFSDERDAADRVKREADILVILGNPPYDGFAGVMKIQEERALSEAYRTVKQVAAPQGQGLNDLYIRFFRMAERRIAEGIPQKDDPKPGSTRPEACGIVCYISNYSWLDGLSHTGMRERFMEVFDSISIDCLNGDKYKTGKRTPDGKPDPSVFTTEKSPVGIQVGTAIALMERFPRKRETVSANPAENLSNFTPQVTLNFRHWWGQKKCVELVQSLTMPLKFQPLKPMLALGLPFVPIGISENYHTWSLLTELLPVSFPGVQTARDEGLVDINKEALVERITKYFDPAVSDENVKHFAPRLMQKSQRFDPKTTRGFLLKRGYRSEFIVRYCYRPFDNRWLYWEQETKLLDEKRAELKNHCRPGNLFLAVSQHQRKQFDPPATTSLVPNRHLLERGANCFPLFLHSDAPTNEVTHLELNFTGEARKQGPRLNLTEKAKEYLATLEAEPENLFFHIVAVLHSPAYRVENAGALRQDWPRVPLPKSAAVLEEGAKLGRQVAALLDPETPVPGVTDLQVRPEWKGLGELAVMPREGKRNPPPDLNLTARWGYAGQGGVVMPGPGKTTTGTRGEGFLDIHLNATTRWKDVPAPVWAYTLGGYQVLKKWLSYRETALLGRPLTGEEAQEFTHHIRRIAAILALHPALDAHYSASI